MFVHDFIQLAVPYGLAKTRLLNGASWWLDSLATEACSDGEGHLVDIGVASPYAGVVKQVHVELGSSDEREGLVTVPLQWRATGCPALFPSLDGELQIARFSRNNTHLELIGRYQPLLGPTGRILDEILIHHIAEGTVRIFLRRIAAALNAPEAEVDVSSRRRTAAPAGRGPSRPGR